MLGFLLISEIKKLILKLNQSKSLPLPIHTVFENQGDDDKAIAIIIGEQHQGGAFRGLNFHDTNKTVIDTLVALYQSPEIKAGDAIKEGISEIFYTENYSHYTRDNFVEANHHPLEALIHLCHKTHPQLKIHAVEKKEHILKFIILAILYYSITNDSIIPFRENNRLIQILLGHAEDKQLIESIIQEVKEELKLEKFISQRIIIHSPIAALYKLMDIELEKKYQSLAEELKVYRLYAVLDPKQHPELELLKLRIDIKIKALNEMRDKYIASQFTQLFKDGVHPIVIGDKHVMTIAKELALQNYSVIALSPFVKR